MQINEESQRDFGKFIKPSKESIFLHNQILFNNVKNYLEKKEYDDNGKIHITFIGGELFHKNIDELYEGFLNTIKILRKIKKITKLFNKELQVRIFSNLLMQDTSLLKFLINIVKENEIDFIN